MYVRCPHCGNRTRTLLTIVIITTNAVVELTDSLEGTSIRIISAEPQKQSPTDIQGEGLTCPACGFVGNMDLWTTGVRCYNCNEPVEQVATTWCQDIHGRVCSNCAERLDSICTRCGYYDNCMLAQNRRERHE